MGDLYMFPRGFEDVSDDARDQEDFDSDIEWYLEQEREAYRLARAGEFRCSLCGDPIPESLLDGVDGDYRVLNRKHMACHYFVYAYDGDWPQTDIELVKAVLDCIKTSPDEKTCDSVGVWTRRFARIVTKFRTKYGDRPSPAAQYESAMMRLITEHPDLDDEEFAREADRIYREHFG